MLVLSSLSHTHTHAHRANSHQIRHFSSSPFLARVKGSPQRVRTKNTQRNLAVSGQGSKNNHRSSRGREFINAIGQRWQRGVCVGRVTSQRRYGRWLRGALTRLLDASALNSHNTRFREKEGGIKKNTGGAEGETCNLHCVKSVYAERWVSSSAGQWVQRRRKNLKRNCFGTWNERWV